MNENGGPAVLRELLDRLDEAEGAASATSLEDTLLQTLIDAMPIGVIICDAQGEILMTSDFGKVILGAQVTGSIGHAERDYVPLRPDGSLLPAEEMPLVRALAEGASCG